MARTHRITAGGAALLLFAACGGSTSVGTGGASGGGGTGGGGTGGAGAVSGGGGTAGLGGGGAGGGTGGSAGGPTDATQCAVPSDCLLLSFSCCGQCGAVVRGDAQALNKSGATEYLTNNCATVDCPPCFQPQDPTLLATCEAGRCTVVDLLTHPSTSCTDATQCRVRTNACCECGGPTDSDHLIAVSTVSSGGYEPLVCDPDSACPECAPVYPAVTLDCVDGHCQITGAGS
jgi:hypothetical protein